jgi:hypothetical protein
MAAEPSFVKDRFLRRNSFLGFQTKKKNFFFPSEEKQLFCWKKTLMAFPQKMSICLKLGWLFFYVFISIKSSFN